MGPPPHHAPELGRGGIEPPSFGYQPNALPLSYLPSMQRPGIEPDSGAIYDAGVEPAPRELLITSAAMGRAGIEPATLASSGRRSTSELPTRERKAEESNPMRLRTTRFRDGGRAGRDFTFQQKRPTTLRVAGLNRASRRSSRTTPRAANGRTKR